MVASTRDCRLRAVGAINALGSSLTECWPRVLAGDLSGLQRRTDLVAGSPLLVGAVSTALPAIPPKLARYDCRNNAFTLKALEPLRDQVREVTRTVGAQRVGVVMGTSTSGSWEAEAAIFQRYDQGALPSRFAYAQLEFGGTADFVCELLELSGPSYSISTACSSGARALASARELIRAGVCDAVIAGGSDSLCRLTTHGFSALQAVSPDASNPFSVHRNGLTLGEGAAVFLVTAEPGGIQLVGVGESSEAHHMSAPDPEGAGAEASMRGALADAGVDPESIGYLNLHGTGTPLNDAMEGAAVHRVLGSDLPCSSTKPVVGHTLGAAGAMEVAFCWMALDTCQGQSLSLPTHRFDGERDPEIPHIHLCGRGETAKVQSAAHVMSNSFGFGGNNCTLVLAAELNS